MLHVDWLQCRCHPSKKFKEYVIRFLLYTIELSADLHLIFKVFDGVCSLRLLLPTWKVKPRLRSQSLSQMLHIPAPPHPARRVASGSRSGKSLNEERTEERDEKENPSAITSPCFKLDLPKLSLESYFIHDLP